MDLSDVRAKDLNEMDNILPADCYIACVDEIKEGMSKNGRHMFTVDVVIAEKAYKGTKIKHWFVVENATGKAVFKHFLRCISKDNVAPDKFSDDMKRHCIGRLLRIGTALEPSGRFVNAKIICLGHESDNQTEFHERHERALLRFDAKLAKDASAPPRKEPKIEIEEDLAF